MGNRGTNDFEKSEESFLTKDESFSDGEREFFNVGREFLYTSCGPAAHAFLPLRSIQAHTASAGQAGFAFHKPLRFRPIGLQTPPVLASPSPQIEAQRSGFDLERRSPAALSKKRQPPKAIAVSEPCAGCSDDVASPFRRRPPQKV